MTLPEISGRVGYPPIASRADYLRITGECDAPSNIDLLLDAASNAIRRAAGWHITPTVQETFILDGSGCGDLHAPTLNMQSVISARVAGQSVEPSGIHWSATGYLRRPGGWSDQLRGVELVAVHGYPHAPELVEMVCRMVARTVADSRSVAKEQAGGVSVEYREQSASVSLLLLKYEQDQLAGYKLPPST